MDSNHLLHSSRNIQNMLVGISTVTFYMTYHLMYCCITFGHVHTT